MQFRCLNSECLARLEPLCQPFEFSAGSPSLCPECGSANVVQLTVIHFDPPVGFGRRAKGFPACDKNGRYGHDGSQATCVPSVVNCPACRETSLWKEAMKAGAA